MRLFTVKGKVYSATENISVENSRRALILQSIYNHLDHLILIIILVFFAFTNYIWLANDTYRPTSDEAEYLFFSLQYLDIFTFKLPLLSFIAVNPKRPPIHMLFSTPIYALFGTSYDVAVMTNVIFMAVLIFSVYGIGKRISNRYVGLLAAFMVVTFPMIFGMARTFYPEIAQTSFVALSIYFLLAADKFRNRKYSLLFGLSVGLGFLTRPTNIVFIIGPVLYILWRESILTFSNICRVLKQLKRVWQSCFVVTAAGIFLGFFIWIVTVISTNNDPRVNMYGDFRVLCAVSSIAICLISWLLISVAITACTSQHLTKILRLGSFPYLSSLLLLLSIWVFYNYRMDYAYYGALLSCISFLLAYLCLLYILRKESRRVDTPLLNFILSLFVATAVFGWWYSLAARRFVPYYAEYALTGPSEGVVDGSIWSVIFYYPSHLLSQQLLSYSYVLLGVIGYFIVVKREMLSLVWHSNNKLKLFLSWLKSETSSNTVILATWYLIPLLFFTRIEKVARFIMPALTPLAIVMAIGILSIRSRSKKIVVITLVVILGLSQFFLLSYGTSSLPQNYTIKTPIGEIFLFGQEPIKEPSPYSYAYSYHTHPIQEDWKIEKIINTIKSDIKLTTNKTTPLKVGVLSGPVDSWTIKYEAYRLRLPGEIISPECTWPPEIFFQEFETFDYMIALNESCKHLMQETPQKGYELFVSKITEFVLIESYQLPDNIIIEIYRRI